MVMGTGMGRDVGIGMCHDSTQHLYQRAETTQPYICVITNTLMVAIRMTMMLKRMLTVLLGVREHEYDNGDDDDDDSFLQLQTTCPKYSTSRWADAAAA